MGSGPRTTEPEAPSIGRRAAVALLAAILLGVPAAAMRLLCVGHGCDEPAAAAEVQVPFCSLPSEVREKITEGFREGRSPELLAVARDREIEGGTGPLRGSGTAWPSLQGDRAASVPLVFVGAGVRSGATLPDGARLDAVAPTMARLMGIERPHPEVRSGAALPEAVASPGSTRLAVLVVLKGIGTEDISEGAWPNLHDLIREGAATTSADPGSTPLDPAAVMTTIGTGGLPWQHGVTGSLIRNDNGRMVRAWSFRAPGSVISSLGDDLVNGHPGARLGAVGGARIDRGLIGHDWYRTGADADFLRPDEPLDGLRRLLAGGYGDDDVPDLLAVALEGDENADERLGEIVDVAGGEGVTFAVTATGPAIRDSVPQGGDVADHLEDRFGPVVEGVAAGGIFLDGNEMARSSIREEQVRVFLERMQVQGRRVFADVFPAVSVTLGRYC